MIKIKKIETVQIEGNTEEEVIKEVNLFLQKGYKKHYGILKSDDPNDEFPFFTFLEIDDFDSEDHDRHYDSDLIN